MYNTGKMAKGLVELRKALNKMDIEVDGVTYNILTSGEAYKQLYDFQQDLFDDMGFDAYSPHAKEYIIDNFVNREWFDSLQSDILEEGLEYLDDVEKKHLLEFYQAETIDDIRYEYVRDNMNHDSIDWYINELAGEDDFLEVVQLYRLLDMDSVVEYIFEWDGYTILASYDGNVEEYYDEEENEVYYIFIEQ